MLGRDEKSSCRLPTPLRSPARSARARPGTASSYAGTGPLPGWASSGVGVCRISLWKQVYKYLKDIKNYNIIYYKNNNYFINKYYDINYINNIKIIKLINNYLILYIVKGEIQSLK